MYFRKIVIFQNTVLVSSFIKTVSLESYTDYSAKITDTNTTEMWPIKQISDNHSNITYKC